MVTNQNLSRSRGSDARILHRLLKGLPRKGRLQLRIGLLHKGLLHKGLLHKGLLHKGLLHKGLLRNGLLNGDVPKSAMLHTAASPVVSRTGSADKDTCRHSRCEKPQPSKERAYTSTSV